VFNSSEERSVTNKNVQSFVSNDSSGCSPMLSASFLSSFLFHNLTIGKTAAQSSTDRNPEGVNGEAIFAADGRIGNRDPSRTNTQEIRSVATDET